jgi:O-antigen/teichoic acid export membrane protein
MWSVRRDLAPVFSVPLCRRMLAFGLPLAFSIIPEWTLSLADRLFLSRYSTLAEIGQYSIAVKVASVLMLVTAGFQQAWSPYLFALLNSGTDYRPVLARVLTGLTLLLAGVGLPLTIFAPEAIRVVAGPGYERAAAAVWLLILGNVAVSLNNILAYGIAIQRKTYFFILLPGIAASTNLILNVFLIPPMGMLGAAWATAASYLLLSALYYRTSQRLIPVALPVKRVSLVLVGLATVGFLAATWPAWAVGSTLAMKSLLLAGAWALAVALLLSPDDRRRLWALAAARWPGNGRPWGA